MDESEGVPLMGSRRSMTILEIDRDAISAVEVQRIGERVVVRQALCERRELDLDPSDASRVGGWIGARLRERGLPRGSVVLALPRRDVVLKRIEAPSEVTDSELDSLVRLQMSRQIAVASQEAVIDYVDLGEEEGKRIVLAGALPSDRYQWLQSVAEHGQLRYRQIRLLASGIEPLLSGVAAHAGQATLAIAAGLATAEIVVIDGGRPVFARSAEVSRPQGEQGFGAYADRLAVEAKRTWMGYRVSSGAQEIEDIAVVGCGEGEEQIARCCAEALELPARTVGMPGWVEADQELGSELLTLVGLGAPAGGRVLDFANPRKVRDASEGRRRAVLLAVLGLLVVGGGAYVLGLGELGRLEGRVASLRSTNGELRGQYAAMLGLSARLHHLEAYRGARPDWVGHLAFLSERLPEPEFGLVNSISGRFEGGDVVFTPTGSGLQGTWDAPALTRFSFSGSATREGLPGELRARLLEGGVYRVRTIGADVGDRYAFELSTGELTPIEHEGDEGGRGSPSSGDGEGGA